MSKKDTVKRLIYKRATFMKGAANLQSLLDTAITNHPAALDREFARADEASLMLNTTRTNVGGATCGVIVRFTRGHNTAIMGLDAKAKELPVSQLAPPPMDGADKTEFVENMGYFAVRGNHAIVVQSMAVRCGQVCDYFNWFLRSRAGLLPKDDRIDLEDVAAEKFRKHKLSDVKAFHFQTGVGDVRTVPVTLAAGEASVLPIGPHIEGLKSLLKGFGITFKDVPLNPLEAQALRVSVSVEVNTREFDKQSVLLNTLGEIANKGAYDDEYVMEFTNGLKLHGSELFISQQVRIPAPGGIPDPFVIFQEMAAYLAEVRRDPRLSV